MELHSTTLDQHDHLYPIAFHWFIRTLDFSSPYLSCCCRASTQPIWPSSSRFGSTHHISSVGSFIRAHNFPNKDCLHFFDLLFIDQILPEMLTAKMPKVCLCCSVLKAINCYVPAFVSEIPTVCECAILNFQKLLFVISLGTANKVIVSIKFVAVEFIPVGKAFETGPNKSVIFTNLNWKYFSDSYVERNRNIQVKNYFTTAEKLKNVSNILCIPSTRSSE